MQENQHASSPVNRIVIVLSLVALVGIVGGGVLFSYTGFSSVNWSEESFAFQSGPQCYVFREPKLAIFLGDGGDEEVFDSVHSVGKMSHFTVNPFFGISVASHYSNKIEIAYYKSQLGKATLRFHNGKCSMVVSRRGTKLTLADGRAFTLDGQTPLWLRCKSDGTIVQLDELPEGFVEFFESPPPDPGLIDSVKSWPEAFQS